MGALGDACLVIQFFLKTIKGLASVCLFFCPPGGGGAGGSMVRYMPMCMYVSNSQGDMLTSSVTTSSHLHLGQPSSKAFNFTIPSCVYGLLFLLSGLVDLLELYLRGNPSVNLGNFPCAR